MANTGAQSARPENDEGFSICTWKMRVEWLSGPLLGQVAELNGPEVRIGSGTGCDLVVADRAISHVHIVLRIEGDRLRILDAKSRNGTYVNGVQIRDAYVGRDSTIAIGASMLKVQMLEESIDIPLPRVDGLFGLLGKSIAMRRVYAQLERLAQNDEPILLEGEIGTEKVPAAAAIHASSPRRDKPFIVFDCSAFPTNQLETELFGRNGGVFMDAAMPRRGRFHEADGGTLFLDEIGELPPELQPKLLRAIVSRTIHPLGAAKDWSVDVRIIAATDHKLAMDVDRDRFREDLFCRLSSAHVRLPPLRERVEDIPMLVRHFEKQWSGKGKPPAPIPEAALERMKLMPWPGNVRELREKVKLMLSAVLADMPGNMLEADRAPNLPFDVDVRLPYHIGYEQLIEQYTKAYMIKALHETVGNIAGTAELFGVGRGFIRRMIRQYNILPAEEEGPNAPTPIER